MALYRERIELDDEREGRKCETAMSEINELSIRVKERMRMMRDEFRKIFYF